MVILGEDGLLLDLHSNPDIFTTEDNEGAFNLLKKNTVPFREDIEYSKVLIIGNSIRLSPETADSLRNFNTTKLEMGGVVRVQICNFKDREILASDHNTLGNFAS